MQRELSALTKSGKTLGFKSFYKYVQKRYRFSPLIIRLLSCGFLKLMFAMSHQAVSASSIQEKNGKKYSVEPFFVTESD